MQCYYINLASRPERRDNMESRFAALGLAAHRIEAATEQDVTDEQRQLYCNPTAFKWQTEKELACSISHLKAFRMFLAGNGSFSAIFEDDVYLAPDFPLFLAEIERELPPVDLIRIETHPDSVMLGPRPEISIGEYGLHKIYQACYGSAAYIISRKAAQFILESNVILQRNTDVALYHPNLAFSRSNRVFHAIPALAIQEHCVDVNINEISDLISMRKYRGRENTKNTLTRLRYYLPDIIQNIVPSLLRFCWLRIRHGVKKKNVPIRRVLDT